MGAITFNRQNEDGKRILIYRFIDANGDLLTESAMQKPFLELKLKEEEKSKEEEK